MASELLGVPNARGNKEADFAAIDRVVSRAEAEQMPVDARRINERRVGVLATGQRVQNVLTVADRTLKRINLTLASAAPPDATPPRRRQEDTPLTN